MGEMIKFGIKIGLTVTATILLVASIALLFVQLSSFNFLGSGSSAVREIFTLISLVLPVKFNLVFALFTPLFAFKIAYWVADKSLWIIDVLG